MATTVGMLPAVLFWAWAMLGFRAFFKDALDGNPLMFLVLCSGFSGIVGVAYLLRLFFSGGSGHLPVALCLIVPALVGISLYIFASETTASILLVTGPILVFVMLLRVTWPQLTSQSKHGRATRAPV